MSLKENELKSCPLLRGSREIYGPEVVLFSEVAGKWRFLAGVSTAVTYTCYPCPQALEEAWPGDEAMHAHYNNDVW